MYPREHGLKTTVGGARYWVPGERVCEAPAGKGRGGGAEQPVEASVSWTAAEAEGGVARPRALELFCGSGSVGRVLKAWGYEVVSLDIDPRRGADICVDILKWNYRAAFPSGHFDLVAASPPCTEYSAVKHKGPRDLKGADKIVRRTLRVIHYFNPRIWWVETPKYGLLARRPFMMGYPRVDVDYCQFENVGFHWRSRD